MSERPGSLTTPRQVEWILYGDAGAAIADLVQSLLPDSATGAHLSSATPVVLIADPDVPSQRVADDLLAVTSQRDHRVWLVVPAEVTISTLTTGLELDRLDSIVVLHDAPPKLAAVALAAWVLLRHDAPSSALSGLRDTSGEVCNVAVVAGAAPAAPPDLSGSQRSRGDLDITAYVPELDAEAQHRADELVESCGADYVRVVEELPEVARDIAQATSTRMLSEWGTATAADLNTAVTTIPEDSVIPDSALSTAMLRVGELSAAVSREESGFGGWWGRRRRISELSSQLKAAREDWGERVRLSTMAATRGDFYRIAGTMLRARIDELVQEERAQRGRSREQAYRAWFAGAEATASSLADIRVSPVHHAWGSANPQTRRHLLLPQLDNDIEVEGSGVVVHEVAGLPTPLAAAVVLGLPLSSVG